MTEHPPSTSRFDTDVAVVGSGFGGSVAALRLTEKGYGVTVFEKGRLWRTQDLPTTNWNIPKSFWFPYLGCRGIFGMRLLREALVLHGAGVGGGGRRTGQAPRSHQSGDGHGQPPPDGSPPTANSSTAYARLQPTV